MGRRRDLWPLAPPFIRGGGAVDKLAEMDWKARRTHQRVALNITSQWNPLFSQEVSPFLLQQRSRLRRKKRCQFHFQAPLFVFLLTRCGNWDRKQTVELGFYFLFKCSHCLRQNCDFPLLAALYKARLPWCPPQMAVQGISFLKALSWVLFFGWESII